MKYICVAPSKEVFDVNGKSLGIEKKRALYYAKDVGRRKIYRRTYLEPDSMVFKLLKYKTKKYAQKVCEAVNEAYNDNFSPVLEGEE